jgi:GxxExxY protein
MTELLFEEITRDIIGAAFDVQKELGYGYLEKVYENALVIELGERGRMVKQQVALDVSYKGIMVGHFVADLLVDDKVLVEVKTGKELMPRYEAQLLNYLKATGVKVGVLVNFAPRKCEYKRMIY